MCDVQRIVFDIPAPPGAGSISRVVALALMGAWLVLLAAGGTVAATGTLVLFGGWIAVHLRGNRAARRALTVQPGSSVPDAALRLFGRGEVAPYEVLSAGLAEHLVRAGHRDLTLRVAAPPQLFDVISIPVQFEPRLLDESDASLMQLAAASGVVPTDRRDLEPGRRATLRRTRRTVIRALLATVLIGLLGVQSSLAIRQSGSVRELAAPALLFVLLIGGLYAGSLIGQRETLVVPGGLLIRRPVRGGWALRLFRRRESVLLATPAGSNSWRVIVADRLGVEDLRPSRVEARILLAAWTSPHEPRGEEAYSDLS